MTLRVKLVTPPALEPVTLAEAKQQSRVDITDDDTYITGLIAAARLYLEGVTRRAFINQTWRLSLSAWPEGDEIELPKPPLQSVTSIVYKDFSGASTTWPAANYIVDTDSDPGRIVLAYGVSWPSVTLYPVNPIQVTYVAGFGDEAGDVPQYLRQAVLLLTAHWYENREPVQNAALKELPLAVDSLIYLNRAY